MEEIIIEEQGLKLNGILHCPPQAKSIVLFAHGSGSSRLSTRNQFVAKQLNEAGIATLLFDLLMPKEEELDNLTREFRFNIPLLADRLNIAAEWILKQNNLRNFNIGYFGASTGGGAAIMAAAMKPGIASAIVSRGGRPDLAGKYLPYVKLPILLIVGGDDYEVIKLNESALSKITSEKKLEIVKGATHLFEEPGKLEKVSQLACNWFVTHLK